MPCHLEDFGRKIGWVSSSMFWEDSKMFLDMVPEES